jgi:hypothetical protein
MYPVGHIQTVVEAVSQRIYKKWVPNPCRVDMGTWGRFLWKWPGTVPRRSTYAFYRAVELGILLGSPRSPHIPQLYHIPNIGD